MIEIEIPMPYYKKGEALMSMNIYRNMMGIALNNFKKKYGKQLAEVLKELDPIETPIQLTYIIVFKGARRRDTNNIASMIDKVFSDVLTQLKLIPDDNYEFVPISKFIGLGNGTEHRCIVKISKADISQYLCYVV